jgi:hypothetical protein
MYREVSLEEGSLGRSKDSANSMRNLVNLISKEIKGELKEKEIKEFILESN